jgi:nucleoside-diphosphate-sugar epimerase
MNQILLNDLEFVKKHKITSEFNNSTILITGATGFIGSLLTKSFLHSTNANVLAGIRNMKKANEVFKDFLPSKQLKFIESDILKPLQIPNKKIDYIFHTASNTTSKFMITNPVETTNISLIGTKNILELAKEKNVKKVIYFSSMEVYGTVNKKGYVFEETQGYIDPLNIRSCYPLSKRMCENLCVSYLKEYNVPTVIARLSSVFGPGIYKDEPRIFASLAKSIIENKDIVLHTTGKSEANYCYSADAIVGLLILSIKGKTGESYNIVNEKSHTTIYKMAQMLVNEFSQETKVIIDIPKNNLGFAPDVKLKLSAKKLLSLGWEPKTSLKNSYKNLIDYLMLS